MYLVVIYSTFHPTATEYSFFLGTHGSFSKIDHKGSLNKYKNIEITACVLSEHDRINLKINNKITIETTENILSDNCVTEGAIRRK
jgi:hypothetical protein